MTISVDIGDRLYDYTDEEKAADAVSEFQLEMGLDDASLIAIWENVGHSLHADLNRRIFAAVDANGSAKRANENVPGDISLSIAGE